MAWGPRVSHWRGERGKAPMGEVDATWRKSRGRWPEWFVGLDVPTARPGVAALLPSRGQGAGRWGGRPLRGLNTGPRGRSTAGFPA